MGGGGGLIYRKQAGLHLFFRTVCIIFVAFFNLFLNCFSSGDHPGESLRGGVVEVGAAFVQRGDVAIHPRFAQQKVRAALQGQQSFAQALRWTKPFSTLSALDGFVLSPYY